MEEKDQGTSPLRLATFPPQADHVLVVFFFIRGGRGGGGGCVKAPRHLCILWCLGGTVDHSVLQNHRVGSTLMLLFQVYTIGSWVNTEPVWVLSSGLTPVSFLTTYSKDVGWESPAVILLVHRICVKQRPTHEKNRGKREKFNGGCVHPELTVPLSFFFACLLIAFILLYNWIQKTPDI